MSDVLINSVYLTGVLHRPYIVAVSWTLCLEVQFYLLFVLTLCVSRSLARRVNALAGWHLTPEQIAAGPFGVGGLISIGILGGWIAPCPGWFIEQWYLFLLGVMAWNVVSRRLSPGWLLAYAGGVLLAGHRDHAAIAGLCTAATVIVGVATTRLDGLLGGRVIQFLGRIPYSLYLVHLVVGSRVLNGSADRFGDSFRVFAIAVPAAITVSVAAAWGLYRFVEQPGVRWGKRLKMRSEYASAARLATVAVG